MHIQQIGIILSWICLIAGNNLRRVVPTKLQIREGEDMQIRLSVVLENEVSCYVRTPQGVNCNLKVQASDSCESRIKYWTENGECGAYIANVTSNDDGAWRLTAKNNKGKRIVDVAEIIILEKYKMKESKVLATSGQSFTYMIPNAEKYCEIKRPHTQHSLAITDECKIELDVPTISDNGTWMAVIGITGQLQEVVESTDVSVSRKSLSSGFKWFPDSNTVHMYCNYQDDENIEFCRFTNLENNKTGFRLIDGLRKGKYGYYGAGLSQGECGLSIEFPDQHDFGLWHCLVGVKGKKLPFAASIRIISPNLSSEVFGNAMQVVKATTWSTSPAITTISQYLKLECFSNVPLSYCWFSLPNRTLFRPTYSNPKNTTEMEYIYRNEELSNGKCTIIITKSKQEYSGTWKCHMGPAPAGIESIENIAVRVTEAPFAAINTIVNVQKIGDSTTLKCNTVPFNIALEYCRFLSPSGLGINVHENLTKERPVQYNNIKYWFSGTSLKLGECGLVIDSTQKEHLGEWTCAARLEEYSAYNEIIDTIDVYSLDEQDTLTAAAGAGIGIVVVVIIGIIGFSIYFVMKKIRNQQTQQITHLDLEGTEQIGLQRFSSSTGSVSSSTTSSEK